MIVMRLKSLGWPLVIAILTLGSGGGTARAVPEAPASTPTQPGAKFQDGKWVLPDGTPTFNVKDGSVDWQTYSGYRRYSSECHVCHGPDGEGSSYAPALAQSLKTMDYAAFLQVVASGKNDNSGGTQFVMPALGDNKNVMCYVDDIYVYLKARAANAVPRGRPDKHADKPKEASAAENSCLGQ